jgi:hypothetical protein
LTALGIDPSTLDLLSHPSIWFPIRTHDPRDRPPDAHHRRGCLTTGPRANAPGWSYGHRPQFQASDRPVEVGSPAHHDNRAPPPGTRSRLDQRTRCGRSAKPHPPSEHAGTGTRGPTGLTCNARAPEGGWLHGKD